MIHCLRAELGYEDKVPVVEALGRTVVSIFRKSASATYLHPFGDGRTIQTEDRLQEIVDATQPSLTVYQLRIRRSATLSAS